MRIAGVASSLPKHYYPQAVLASAMQTVLGQQAR